MMIKHNLCKTQLEEYCLMMIREEKH